MFLHGGGVAGWMWQRQVEYFGATHQVVVPDLPGHGRSGAAGFTTIAAAADRMAGLIRDLGPARRVGVVGFSLGAQIAVDLASRHQGIVDSAVLVSALVLPLPAARLAGPLLRSAAPLRNRRWFARLQARSMFIPPGMFGDYVRSSGQVSAHSLGNILRENAAYRIPAGWRTSTARTLILAGRQERRVMRRSAAALHAGLPGSELRVLPGCGHGIPLQEPDAFNAITAEWICAR
ncbi:alpha/beta fold hydrolase [Arthrobacter sp. GCM10027362]